jgi:surfeit locus 1 family protein
MDRYGMSDIEPKGTFSPPVWATLGTLLACGLFVWAGFWQLDRGDQKRRLFEAFDAGSSAELLTGQLTDDLPVESRYRRVRISGEYDSRHQILLDSMMHGGQSGYYVLTPLRTGQNIILVNRGWVPADRDRAEMPDVSVAENNRKVTGRLDLLPRPGVKLASQAPEIDTPWPRRLLYPSVTEIGEQLGDQPYPMQLLLDANNTDGFLRDWRPPVMGPERHLGYAVQWFGLAVTLMIIYIVVNMKKTVRT